MADVPLAFTDWERVFADLPAAVLKNRFFERNPSQVKGTAALARPATVRLDAYGTGPIRGFYSLTGLHDSALFFVSGNTMYRRETDGSTVAIAGTVFGDGAVSMTGVKGPSYEYLFIADGSHLQVYQGGTNATATLTASGQVSDLDTIRIGDTYYQWTNPTTAGTMDTGAGTSADPWKVKIGSDITESLSNMVAAINFTGTPGDNWSPNLGGQNADVTAAEIDTAGVTLVITSRSDLAEANSTVTTVTSGDTVPNIAWGGGTMSGGGTHGLNGIEVPDGQPPLNITTLNGYILVAIGDSDRFYWIEPGELIIDPLDFATAESHPDQLVAVEAVGDTAWLIGNSSSEVWYTTGNDAAPFAPVSGRTYPYGAVEGTVVNVRDTIYLVGEDNVVYAMGGTPQRVSNHGVEELIRTSLSGE